MAGRSSSRAGASPWCSRPAGTVALAEEFVRFLVGEGWLAHWLTFAGDRYLPPCASWSNSRSGSTRGTRIACARPSRS